MDIITLALAKKFAKEYTDTHASKLTEEDAVQAVANYFNENPNAIVTNDELTDILDAVDNKINKINSAIGINNNEKGELINLSKDNQGYVMSSGRLVADLKNTYCYTNLIEVVSGETYEFVLKIHGNLGIAYYGSDKKYISGISGTEINGSSLALQSSITFQLTIPKTAKYIRVSHDYSNSADKFTMQQITGVEAKNEIEKLKDRVTSLE